VKRKTNNNNNNNNNNTYDVEKVPTQSHVPGSIPISNIKNTRKNNNNNNNNNDDDDFNKTITSTK